MVSQIEANHDEQAQIYTYFFFYFDLLSSLLWRAVVLHIYFDKLLFSFSKSLKRIKSFLSSFFRRTLCQSL